MVVLDDTDIKILRIFHDLEEDQFTGTLLITESIYPDMSKPNLLSKERTINYRIKRMSPDLIKIERKNSSKNKNIKYEYLLISKNVIFKKHSFPNGIRNALLVRLDSKWSIFEL